ncbi:hypothetical protein GJ496_002048 [Pomphorhynchus laevis]|nr:hypothetical protein GJ496_002048 [Pomphorhynchus laevis]
MDDVDMNNSGCEDDVSSSATSDEEPPTEEELHALVSSDTDKSVITQVLNASRQLGYLNLLRKCRRWLADKHPQNEEFWINWIEDELRGSIGDVAIAVDVCERALNDLFSAKVWHRYLLTIKSKKLKQCEDISDLFRKALRIAALDFDNGHLIWNAYHKHCHSTGCISGFDALNRQLRIPLSAYDKSSFNMHLNMYGISMESAEILANLNTQYERNCCEVHNRLQFNSALVSANSETIIHQCHRFVLFENSHNRFDLTLARYEKSVQLYPTIKKLWRSYLFYAIKDDVDLDILLQICDRAIRNCPSISEFRIQKAITLERLNNGQAAAIKSVYNDALNTDLQSPRDYAKVWIAFISYLRRCCTFSNPDGNFEKEFRGSFLLAINQLFEYFETKADPDCFLERFWAYSEAKYFNNMNRAREIWRENIFEIGHSGKFSFWKEYLDLERQFGDEKHYRRALAKSLSSVIDEKMKICNLAENFEIMNGLLPQLYQMNQLTEEIKLTEKYSPIKRKHSEDHSETHNIASKYKKREKKILLEAQPHNQKSSSELMVEDRKPDRDIGEISLDPDCCVFLSNLSFDCSENDILQFFNEKVGNVVTISIARNQKNFSKGYGHVQFKSKEFVQNALALDHSTIYDRPMYISEYRQKTDKQNVDRSFKYPIGMERCKLFISNLSKSVTSEELSNIFKEYGKLKDVRVVTYKNGNSKGLAYIEYTTAKEASKALIKTDGMQIKELKISVAVSNTPARKQQSQQQAPARKFHLQFDQPSSQDEQTAKQVNDPQPIKLKNVSLSNQQFREMLFK